MPECERCGGGVVNGHAGMTTTPMPAPSSAPTLAAGARLRRMTVTAVFVACKEEVAQARYFAEAMLAGWPAVDDAVLIVSEFAANAVVHSASEDGGQFWVRLETVPGEHVRVEVRDQGGSWTRRDHQDDRPHGLEIVGLLASDSGVDGDARSGWIAWARLDLPKASTDIPARAAVVDCIQPAAEQPPHAANGHAGRSGSSSAPAGALIPGGAALPRDGLGRAEPGGRGTRAAAHVKTVTKP